jgi:ABC-2 type transport system permease protein
VRVPLLVAAKDFRQRLRDRSAILVSVVAPLGLAVIFSQLLGSATGFQTRWIVADLDGGAMATVLRQEVIGSLAAAGVAEVSDAPTAPAARDAVAAGEQEVAFVIPADFSARIQAGSPVAIEILGSRDEGLATEIARSVATRFGNGVVAVQLAVHTAGELAGQPLPPAEQGRIAAAAAGLPTVVALVDETTPLRQLNLSTYFAASMSILFLFFAAGTGIVSLFEERRNGTLARILAGPVRPTSILAGKSLGSFVLGIVALTVLIAATTLLIGADWGPPPGVILLVIAAVVSAIGISTLVASFAKTAQAAAAASSAVAITLGILGGTFSPTAQAPDVMATLALLTPHGWFLRGLGDMHGTGSSAADALPAVAVLLAIGGVTYALGALRVRRLVAAR